jgi:hypothetical protein
MRTLLLGPLAFLVLVSACTKALPKNPPLDTDGPVDCLPEQFKSKEKCFDHAHDACASLGCVDGACSIHRARSSKWVVCDPHVAWGGSHLTECGGYANWSCPENTVCRDNPAPGHCKAASALDCQGICVPAADAGPPSPGRY